MTPKEILSRLKGTRKVLLNKSPSESETTPSSHPIAPNSKPTALWHTAQYLSCDAILTRVRLQKLTMFAKSNDQLGVNECLQELWWS